MIGAQVMNKLLVAAIIFGAVSMPFSAEVYANDVVNTGYFGGVAIMGYDPVAYFTDGAAVKGSEEFRYDWLGTPWLFASRAHKDLFKSDPTKYAPQFGGYCAGEVTFDGITVNIDPEAWRIIDGKLYLGYDKGFIADLEANPQNWLPKAEENWPKLAAKLAQGEFH
jgi:YHS domain-containing protein